MPVVAGNHIYELIHKQRAQGQDIYNIWYFQSNQTPATPAWENLAEAFEAEYVSEISTLQHANLTNIEYTVRKLNSLTDFGVYTPTITNGTRSGSMMPTFVSWSFTLERTTKETRVGHKRISAMVEEDVLNQQIDPSSLTDFQDVVAALPLTTSPIVQTFSPVIVGGKTLDGVAVPESSWVFQEVQGFTLKLPITSQVSRKLGVGS